MPTYKASEIQFDEDVQPTAGTVYKASDVKFDEDPVVAPPSMPPATKPGYTEMISQPMPVQQQATQEPPGILATALGKIKELMPSFAPPTDEQMAPQVDTAAVQTANKEIQPQVSSGATPKELSIGMPSRTPKRGLIEGILPDIVRKPTGEMTSQDRAKASNIMALQDILKDKANVAEGDTLDRGFAGIEEEANSIADS